MGLLGRILGGTSEAAGYRAQSRQARGEKRAAVGALASLNKNRQAVINPYSNVTNLSSLAKDLTGNLSNPFANLSVSTAAADMQAEQTDIALANTLDTIRATGGGAGGATALAQAALQGKKGIAASIEQQETKNEKLAAQGQQTLEQLQNSEKQRIQGVQLSEGQRIQDADVQGQDYKFRAQERRDESTIGDLRGQRDDALARQYNYTQASIGATAKTLGNI
jgi:hypothetical protein|tara:strand:- start:2443 stop:3108 length:666 start_codon:yes stop_codon:yes gene_type:complete